jgi:hypothetical protein
MLEELHHFGRTATRLVMCQHNVLAENIPVFAKEQQKFVAHKYRYNQQIQAV